jgi:hypothetical protein
MHHASGRGKGKINNTYILRRTKIIVAQEVSKKNGEGEDRKAEQKTAYLSLYLRFLPRAPVPLPLAVVGAGAGGSFTTPGGGMPSGLCGCCDCCAGGKLTRFALPVPGVCGGSCAGAVLPVPGNGVGP